MTLRQECFRAVCAGAAVLAADRPALDGAAPAMPPEALAAAIAAAEEARVRGRFAMQPAPERHAGAPETRTRTQGEPP